MKACPSCNQPFHNNETEAYGAEESATHCSNCGEDISGDEVTSAYFSHSTDKSNRIANFSLVRILGQGGFGAVWLAEDKSLGRQVALKLPKATDKDATLLHEAQTAARLRHPSIVSIYEVGIDEGQVFIASEYIDGEDLRNELANGRPVVSRAVRLIATLARAVDHAHENGVVHRDLKPANIILNSNGEPFITDFGIAKHLSDDETISTDGEVVGTISYMSPEQARGSTRDTDSRADTYALGVILFEMLTEFRPFRGNARAVIHQKIYDDAPSPRKLVPSLAKDLETICLKCLEREPAKRYSSAAELADELERFENNIPIKARPISRTEKVWRWCRRKPAVAALLFGLFVSLTTGLASTSYFWQQAAESETTTRESLYRAHMTLAGKLWLAGDIAGLQQTLDNYNTESPTASLQSFEWKHYSHLAAPFRQTVNHGEVVTDVAVSYDGRLFASVGNDRVVRIWNSNNGQLTRSLQPRAGRPGTIEFSPVDDRLVSAHGDGTARLWNPQQHDRIVREFKHGPGLTHAAFSADGKLLVSGGSNGKTLVWKVGTGEQFADISQAKRAVRDLSYSPDERHMVIAYQGGLVCVWDRESPEDVQFISAGTDIFSVDFVDDSQTIVVGTYGGSVHYYSTETGKLGDSVYLDPGVVGDVNYLRSIDRLAVVTTAHRMHLLDENRHSVKTLATHSLTHGMLAGSQDGSTVAVGSGDGSVKLLDVTELEQPDVFWHDTHVRAVVFVNGGRHVASCNGIGEVNLWDVETGEMIQLLEGTERELLALAVHPTNNLLAVSGMTREINLFDTKLKTQAASIPLPYAGFSTLAFSADGRQLAAGSRSGELRVYAQGEWDEPAVELTESDVQIAGLAFLPSTGFLAVAYSDGHIKLLDTANGGSVVKAIELKSPPLAMTTFGGGQLLAIGTQSGEMHLLDAATLAALQTVKAHSSRINTIASFPGGDRLVTGGRDRELRIWDTRTGDISAALTGHSHQVFAVAVSADGNTVASCGLAGDVRLWRSNP